jgi:hypothetical protein
LPEVVQVLRARYKLSEETAKALAMRHRDKVGVLMAECTAEYVGDWLFRQLMECPLKPKTKGAE